MIFCSPDNHDHITSICNTISPDIEIIVLDRPIATRNDYNNLMLDPWFWDQLPCDKVLIYQTDTFIFKSLDPLFLKYDYVGAPWGVTQNALMAILGEKIPFGNGGLSLRSVAVIKEIITTYKPLSIPSNWEHDLEYIPEDVFFSMHLHQHPEYHYSATAAQSFSYEEAFIPDTFGAHRPWLHEDSFYKQLRGVNTVGFTNGMFGLGKYGRMMVSLLDILQIPYNVYELEYQQKKGNFLKVNNELTFPVTFFFCNPDVMYQLSEAMFDNRYTIGYWFWELEKIPDDWKRKAEKFNEIWVATDFLENIFRRELPDKIIRKIPAPFDIPKMISRHESRKQLADLKLRDEDFVFLFMFDYFSDIYRKNPHALIDAFKKISGRCKNSKLIIKSHSGDFLQIAAMKKYINDDDHIIFINESYSEEDTSLLMNACDVYVSPHRSEGLGLTVVESILLEKPVITTNYSGPVEFCLPDCISLIDYNMVSVPADSMYRKNFFTDADSVYWADPNVDDMAKKMELVYHHYSDYQQKVIRNKDWLLKTYSPEKSLHVFQEAIEDIIKKASTML